jgi:hypothetical protein
MVGVDLVAACQRTGHGAIRRAVAADRVARTPWFRGLGTMYDQEAGVAEYAARLPIVVGAVVAVVEWLVALVDWTAVVDVTEVSPPVEGMIVPVVVPVDGLPDVPADEGPVVLGTVGTPDELVRVG